MHDSSGNGLDGVVDPSGVQSGAVVRRRDRLQLGPPTAGRAAGRAAARHPGPRQHEPRAGQRPSFTVEICATGPRRSSATSSRRASPPPRAASGRSRTRQGIPSCLFKGSRGRVATGAKTPINDNEWHDLTCVLTTTGVTMYVDGVERSHLNGSAGHRRQPIPMTIGGKINCDQVEITCDYFSGQIDYVKITKSVNAAPAPSIAPSCSGLTCAFDGRRRRTPTAASTSYAWSFGDGGTSTAVAPSHAYATAGTLRRHVHRHGQPGWNRHDHEPGHGPAGFRRQHDRVRRVSRVRQRRPDSHRRRAVRRRRG